MFLPNTTLLCVNLDLPGVRPEDINLTVAEDHLSVSAVTIPQQVQMQQ